MTRLLYESVFILLYNNTYQPAMEVTVMLFTLSADLCCDVMEVCWLSANQCLLTLAADQWEALLQMAAAPAAAEASAAAGATAACGSCNNT